jgi:uncharacterized membrane protein
MDDLPPKISFAAKLRNSFMTGIIIIAPVTITIWLLWTFLNWADSWVKPYIPARYDPEQYLNVGIPGLGLLIGVIIITLIGFLGSNLIGQWVLGVGESALSRMPFVRPVYKSIKQLFETVLKEQSSSFKKVGLIEFPMPGTWALGFIASETQGEIAHRFNEMGMDMVTVFVPPTPVPTAGFLLFVPRDKVVMLEMSTEDAAKLLISGGIVSPDFKVPESLPDQVSVVTSSSTSNSTISASTSSVLGAKDE